MREPYLLHELILVGAERAPHAPALVHGNATFTYEQLASDVLAAASGFVSLDVPRAGRIATFLEKRPEMVSCCFAAAAMGGVFVPINPLLKPEQVAFVMSDCDVQVLVTSPERWRVLAPAMVACPALCHVVPWSLLNS